MPHYRTIPSRSETRIARATVTIALAAILVGCAAQGGGQALKNTEPTFMRLTEERVFGQALRQRYLELATNAYDRADFARSDFYSLRAIMAVEGKLVDPSGQGRHLDPPLNAARIRLVRSLSAGSRIGSPDLAARAQAAYDCWWLESQGGGDAAIARACAYNATAALGELEVIGTGTRVAQVRSAPQQVVINSETRSQTFNDGGAMIEVINAQPVLATPVAPAVSQPNMVETQAILSTPPAPFLPDAPLSEMEYIPPPVQYGVAPMEAMQGIEPLGAVPVESVSARTFVVEPLLTVSAADSDTILPTVPLQDSLEPIDLIAEYDAPAAAMPSPGGQYVASESLAVSPGATMAPIYDDAFPALQDAPMASTAPVYSAEAAAPQMVAPVMMEQSGDVLSTLVKARTAGSSDFAVYFGFDSDQITLEGQDVLGDTIERLALGGHGAVSLMGFTDSSGDSRYNQLLAMRRANAVRSFIQQRSDRPLRFEIMPVGEAEAVRDGGDGVTEALNRRVEIILR